MTKWCTRLFVHVVTLATGGLAAAPAHGQIPTTQIVQQYQDALVRIERTVGGQHRVWGSGVVINTNPPVVVTCYHVIQGEGEIRVLNRTVSPKKWGVQSIAIDAKNDRAFLWLDKPNWPTSVPWSAAPPPQELVAADFTGFGYGGYNDWRFFHFHTGANPLEELGNLGGPEPLKGVDSALHVLAFTPSEEFVSGDSGAPIFDTKGHVIGLAAGTIDFYGARRYDFGIPSTAAVPLLRLAITASTIDSSQLPPGPYGSSAIALKLAVDLRAAPQFAPDQTSDPALAKCFASMYVLVARFAGKREQLPAEMPSEQRGEKDSCNILYRLIRTPLIEQEREYIQAETLQFLAKFAHQAETLGSSAGVVLQREVREQYGDQKVSVSLQSVMSGAEKRAWGQVYRDGKELSSKTKRESRTWGELGDVDLKKITAEMIRQHELVPDAELSRLRSGPATTQSKARTNPVEANMLKRLFTKPNSLKEAVQLLDSARDFGREIAASAVEGTMTSEDLNEKALRSNQAADQLTSRIDQLLKPVPPPVVP